MPRPKSSPAQAEVPAPTVRTKNGPDRALTCREVQLVLSVSRTMVYQLRAAGLLPPVTVGTAVRFRQSEVARILANGADLRPALAAGGK